MIEFRLSQDNIEGENLVVTSHKTNVKTILPIGAELKQLLSDLPKPMSEPAYNRSIKELCRLSGVKKWANVTSHTARRSFATNMYKHGIPASSLMMLTGHKTESSFFVYIKTTLEENAENLREQFPELYK